VRGFTRINKRNFEISWNLYKKGINYAYIEDWTNAGKFATFWMFPKSIYHSFVLQMTLIYALEAAERKNTCAISKHMKTYESG